MLPPPPLALARPDANALPPACLNCGHPFGAPRPRYCPACSQESNVKPPTVREFAQQFGGAYFATEGALWRTLKLLLFKPGELTARYLAGQRKTYLLPLRLYLSISVVLLLLLRVSSHLDFGAVDDPDVADLLPERPRSVQLELGFGSAGISEGVFYCTGLSPWICKRLQRRLDVDTRAMVQEMRVVSERVAGNAGAMMCVLMPVFALGLWLLWHNRGLRYTEHLVFALHLHALWSLVAALVVLCLLIGADVMVLALLLLVPLYSLLALRRVYGGRWWPLLLRAGALGGVHAALVSFATLAAVLVATLI